MKKTHFDPPSPLESESEKSIESKNNCAPTKFYDSKGNNYICVVNQWLIAIEYIDP